jgi:hypothetical protein
MIITPTNANHIAATLTPEKSKGLTATASEFAKWVARLSILAMMPVAVVATVTVFPAVTVVFASTLVIVPVTLVKLVVASLEFVVVPETE